MIKRLTSFLICMVLYGNAYGGINGSADPRIVIGWSGERPEYVPESTPNLWDTSPYRTIVRIEMLGYGTGEFISPRHVLTNTHVAQDCGINGNEDCMIYTSDEEFYWGRVAFSGMTIMKPNGDVDDDKLYGHMDKDWAILEIIEDYCHPEYRDIQEAGTIERGMWRAGFGSLRVLSEFDIDAIRRAYLVYLDAGGADAEETGGMNIDRSEPKFQVFRDEFERITGKDFDEDYDADFATLKLVKDCRFRGVSEEIPNGAGLRHSCSGWPGDSGSAIKLMYNNDVVGLNCSGYRNITSYTEHTGSDTALAPYMFIDNPKIQFEIEKAKKDCAKK